LLALYRRQGNEAAARAALDAIAAVGWDNPQLYAWAWQHIPAASTPRLDIDAPLVGIARGVYAAEQDNGRVLRWTLERAQFRVDAPQASRLRLTLRAPSPGKAVEVWTQGRYAGTLQVGPTWQEYTLPLVGSAADGWWRVELRTHTTVRSPTAPYPRGVALRALQLE
jgi:hypothetical protein